MLMLQAILRGKLSRDHEQIEDILTSNVFGLLRYEDPRLILEWLGRAIMVDGRGALDYPLLPSEQISIAWEFWPYWSEEGCNACEPDVVITVRVTGESPIHVLIEAKLNAGKSSRADDGYAPADQLAREWDNFVARSRAEGARLVLIYLTSHFSLPRSEIEASISEFRSKRGADPVIAWLSWRELSTILARSSQGLIRRDLVLLLKRMGLTFYEGVASVPHEKIRWRFDAGGYKWSIDKVAAPNWRFT